MSIYGDVKRQTLAGGRESPLGSGAQQGSGSGSGSSSSIPPVTQPQGILLLMESE